MLKTYIASLALFTLITAAPSMVLGNDASADAMSIDAIGISDGIDHCLEQAGGDTRARYGCIGLLTRNCLSDPVNQTTMGMEQCHRQELAGWDELLNRYYQTLRADGALPELRDTQRQWIAYRDSKCAFYNVFYEGGSMARWLQADCLRQETARRVIDLFFFVVEVDGR